jgi:hypothetical protein
MMHFLNLFYSYFHQKKKKTAKNGKAPSKDEINSELYKYG